MENIKTCIYCGTPITTPSMEHIIQQAIGGRYESADILCPKCNEIIGQRIDAPFSSIFNPIVDHIEDFIKQRKQSHPSYKGTAEYSGVKYDVIIKNKRVVACPELSRTLRNNTKISKLNFDNLSYEFDVKSDAFLMGLRKIAFNFAIDRKIQFSHLQHGLDITLENGKLTDIAFNYPIVPFIPLNPMDQYLELNADIMLYHIFHNLKPVQEKSLLGFLNLLLSSEERENVITIIDQIAQLSPKQREDFASVLKRTHLENIIATIKFIEDRYKVIEALKTIVLDHTVYANERDHVQKIVEQHYWLFGEQYHLVTADKRMQTALEKYLYLLYGDNAPDAVLAPDEEELRRMDIFACGARNTEDASGNATQENLIVELKAPKVVLTKKVLRQLEDYMDYIRKQPAFNSQYRKWKFVAVCVSIDDDVKARYESQKHKGKKGLVTDIDNYEIYALTWDDVFQSFELRHAFLLDKLKTDRDAIADEVKNSINEEYSRGTADALTALVTQ